MYLIFTSVRISTCKVLKRISRSNEAFHQITRSVSKNDNKMTTASSVKMKLTELNVPYEDGYTCLKIKKCKYCSTHKMPSKHGTLYVNYTTGSFLCYTCQMHGDWETLKNIISHKSLSQNDILDIKKNCVRYYISCEWKSILDGSEALSDMKLDQIYDIMEKFGLVKCSKDKVDFLKIRIEKNHKYLVFPIELMNAIAGYLILDESGNVSTFPRTDCPSFLSYSKGKSYVSAIVVANIHDFIALVSQNLEHEIICLPYGMSNLPQSSLPKFECFHKIIFWLEPKYALVNSCHQFARKLGEKRCYVIKPKESQISPFQAVKNCESLNNIIKDAKPVWHQFVTNFACLKEDVLAEILNLDELTGIAWTRYTKLNEILKGHRRGELTIVTGATGCGKTTFLSEYSLDLAMSGVNTLWGSFEVKNVRLVRIMLQQFAGKSFTADNIKEFDYFSAEFEKLPIYFLTFHGQESITPVMKAVEHCSYIYDIAHVIIDNVQFMIDVSLSSNIGERFWIQDHILQSFRRFATQFNCHVTLVVHPRKESDGLFLHMNSIFGSAKTAQEADNVFILQQDINQATGTGSKKYLQVCKNRFAGNLGSIPLEFNKNNLTFSKKEFKNSKTPSSSNEAQYQYEAQKIRESFS